MTLQRKPLAGSAILLAVLLAPCASGALADRTTPSRVMTCAGPFGRNASHADLVKAFGKNNVVHQDMEDAEGRKIQASVLHPHVPKARLEFIWDDEKARRKPQIRARDQSSWASANGVRTGMALADIEKMNGKPFKLSGFDWDYGGLVTDWQGGALAKAQSGGCLVNVGFVHPEDAPEANLAKVTGDSEFLSDNADMRAVEPYVAVVIISYPKR